MSFRKRVRFLWHFFWAFFRKHYLTLLVGIFLGFIFFCFTPKVIKYFSKKNNLLKIGVVGSFDVNNIPNLILKELSIGLTSISEKGEPFPSLAEKWEVSDEGKVYTFFLKEKQIYWHNNQSFSPADINYNFKDIDVAIEKNKIIFKLKESFSPFPLVVSQPLFKKGLIGLGDYKVERIVRKGNKIESILLEPFRNSLLNRILYRFFQNEDQLKTAFNLGEVDIVNSLFDLRGVYLGKNVNVEEYIDKNLYLAVFFDTSKPIFSEKSFRQALSYAIKKESGEKRALGPISPLSWAYNADVKPYNYDLNHAKSLLNKEGSDQTKNKIKITTFPQYENLANLLKESWNELGIPTEVEFVQFIPSDFDVLLIARKIPEDPDQYYFWHSTQAGNLSKFKNPRIDKLLEDGRKTTNVEERKYNYFDFQRFLVEESPVIFLTHPVFYNITRD